MKNANASTLSSTPLKWASWVYLLGLLLGATLAFSDDVLDRTFLPRLGLAFSLLPILAFIIFKERKKVQWPQINLFFYAFLLFFLWNLQSLFWVDTFSEALLECQRVFLSIAIFWLSLFFLKNDEEFESRLLKLSLLLGLIAIAIATWQIFQIGALDKLSLYEVKGISGHRNLFGAFMFLMLGFALMAAEKLPSFWKIAARIVAALFLLLLFILQARSAWVALVAGSFCFAILYVFNHQKIRLNWRLPLLVLFLFILSLSWYSWQGGLSQFLERINVTQYLGSETAVERQRLWDKTLCTFQKNPLMGVGAGNWQTHFAGCNIHGLYSVEINNVTYQRPHNDFLWVLSETGLIGFLLYLFFLLGLLFYGIKYLKRTTETNLFPGMTRLSLLVGLLVIACFSFPKERVELIVWMYILLALIYHHAASTRDQNKRDSFLGQILLIVFMLGSSFSVYTLGHRAQGEFEMNQIYFLKAYQKWPELLAACDAGESRFYTLDPNAIPINWYRGTGHFSQGKFAAAKEDFEEALKIAPYSQHCWNDLGSCLEKLGQRKEAKDCYLQALTISPMFNDPRLNLGILYYKDGDFITAKNYFTSMQDSIRAKPYLEIIEQAQSQN